MTAAARAAAVGMMLAAVAVASCAAPSRRLSPRVVEDPIVLPARMASVALGGFAGHYEPTDVNRTNLIAGFRLGITNRLEWVDLLSLRYALLDDRPADGRPPRPLSLALGAGVTGIGYSSVDGVIVLPVASLDALKHVADRWALSLSLSWRSIWTQRTWRLSPGYTNNLGYSTNSASSWMLRAVVARQLVDRVAVDASAWVSQEHGCLAPTCPWVARGAGGALAASVRPWHWLTVAAGPVVGIRYRPDGPLAMPVDPTTPVVIPLRRIEWVGLFGSATFYW